MADRTPSGSTPTDSTANIAWREWDADVFADAAASSQLLLLVISPGWHPGLQTFEDTALSDPLVVQRLTSQGVIPLRVDADERPDLALRYGHPDEITTVVLGPQGEPLESLTQPEAGPLLKSLDAWQLRWRESGEELLAELEAESVLRRTGLGTARGELTPALLDIALERAEAASDLAGPERVRLWLYAHRRRADLDSERRARMAIQRRVDGGGFDLAVGAFRHCPDLGPLCVPRLAEDQGRWLSVLARIAAEDSEAHEWVLQAVSTTIDFVETELLNSSGGFAYAIDDTRVLAAPNAHLARGLLACGIVFDRREWRSRGRTAVDFLVRRMPAGQAGYYQTWDGGPRTLGLLSAQVATGQALLDTYEATGATDYLQAAQAIARLLDRQFQTPDGPLADVDARNESIGLLEEPRYPLLDNAEAAELLIRLGHLTHDDRYVDIAYAILGAVVGDLQTIDLEAACALARVADRLLSVEPEVKIISFSPPGEIDSLADPIHAEALRIALAAHTVQRLNPELDDVLITQLGVPAEHGGAHCFVSGDYGALLTHPDELLPAIERAISLPA